MRDERVNIPQRPICYECQARGYECILQRGEPCLGPIILGGCEAICLKSKMACQGCRGLFEDAQVKTMMKKLIKEHGQEKMNRIIEIFGLRDDIEEKL